MSEQPTPDPPEERPPRFGPWRFVAAVADRYSRHNGPLLAAAISFYLLLSLAPLILVGLAGFGYFLDWRPDLLNELRVQIGAMLPTKALFAQEIVDGVVRQRHALGIFGLLALLATATQGFSTVSQAINIIWETPHRSFLHRRLFALQMLLVLGGLFILSTAGATFLHWLASRPGLSVGERVWTWLQWAVIPGLSVTLFTLTYRWTPSKRRPSWPAALFAGLLAGLAWEFAKTPFTLYLSHIDKVSVAPASLATFIGLALWGYYSGMVLLLGAAVAATMTPSKDQKPASS